MTRKPPPAPRDDDSLLSHPTTGIERETHGRFAKGRSPNPGGRPRLTAEERELRPRRDGFSERYARAREIRAELWLEEMLEIAHDGTNDFRRDEKGTVSFGSTARNIDPESSRVPVVGRLRRVARYLIR
jgi:hypothetical protein